MKYNFIWNLLGYDVDKYIKELDRLRLLSVDDFHRYQLIKKNKIFQHHYHMTSWYKNLVGSI